MFLKSYLYDRMFGIQPSSSSNYFPIEQDEDEEKSAQETSQAVGDADSQNRLIYYLLGCATTIIVVCAIVNTMILVSIISRYLLNSDPPLDLDAVELRSPYVNFDNLYANTSFRSSKHDPVVNHARVMAQVSSEEPDTVLPAYTDMRLANSGMMPVNTRRLLLANNTSTIAQFRVMDYGMEKCSLVIIVPPKNKTEDVLKGFEEDMATIDIWALSTTKRLNPKTLTWKTLEPQSRSYFGKLNVTYGRTNETPSFECQSFSYQTFQLSCSTANCKIDVLGIGKDQSGLYMRQHQTI